MAKRIYDRRRAQIIEDLERETGMSNSLIQLAIRDKRKSKAAIRIKDIYYKRYELSKLSEENIRSEVSAS